MGSCELAIGGLLERIRLSRGIPEGDLCRCIGWEPERWRDIKSGRARLGLRHAAILAWYMEMTDDEWKQITHLTVHAPTPNERRFIDAFPAGISRELSAGRVAELLGKHDAPRWKRVLSRDSAMDAANRVWNAARFIFREPLHAGLTTFLALNSALIAASDVPLWLAIAGVIPPAALLIAILSRR
jgi:hypothetical protein